MAVEMKAEAAAPRRPTFTETSMFSSRVVGRSHPLYSIEYSEWRSTQSTLYSNGYNDRFTFGDFAMSRSGLPRLSIRIDFDEEGRLGPGKVALLEHIAQEGSISAAGRSMQMSYKRAWELVADINRSFEEPLVTAQTGGRQAAVRP